MRQPELISERLPAPDLIRGIALLGIGAENILSFSAANEHIALYAASFPEPVNKLLLTFFMLFLRGKFYPVFALLFGFAAALSLAQRGSKPFFRRSLFIGVLGMLQLFFVWNGDVLLQYAFLSLLLFVLKDWPGKWLALLAGSLFLFSFFLPVFYAGNGLQATGIPPEIYAEASFLTLFNYRATEFFQSIPSTEFFFFLGRIFAFMLLGYWLGRDQNFRKFLTFRKAFWMLGFVVAGFLFSGILLQITGLRGEAIRSNSLEILKATVMALFFLANVLVLILVPLLLFLKLPELLIWKPLLAAGRLTLTHYLLQNLIFSFVFYGYGLGWYLQIPPMQLWAAYMLLVLFQALISAWWLKNFKQGPVEYLLRRYTYRS